MYPEHEDAVKCLLNDLRKSGYSKLANTTIDKVLVNTALYDSLKTFEKQSQIALIWWLSYYLYKNRLVIKVDGNECKLSSNIERDDELTALLKGKLSTKNIQRIELFLCNTRSLLNA